MAAQALTKGVSRCVTIKVSDGLDTHQGAAWQNDHGPFLQEGFDSIAALVQYLSEVDYDPVPGNKWIDHTTIICFSEFGRGALLNSNGGRDHNLINSMLLMGGGIKGGQVIGATSDLGMQAQPIDLTTGVLDAGGEVIGNNHIARTLLHSIGVDDDIGDFSVAYPALWMNHEGHVLCLCIRLRRRRGNEIAKRFDTAEEEAECTICLVSRWMVMDMETHLQRNGL